MSNQRRKKYKKSVSQIKIMKLLKLLEPRPHKTLLKSTWVSSDLLEIELRSETVQSKNNLLYHNPSSFIRRDVAAFSVL